MSAGRAIRWLQWLKATNQRWTSSCDPETDLEKGTEEGGLMEGEALVCGSSGVNAPLVQKPAWVSAVSRFALSAVDKRWMQPL